MVFLAPEVTGGVAVAYLVDGRMKLPKTTPVFEIGDEEMTSGPICRQTTAKCFPSRLAPAAKP